MSESQACPGCGGTLSVEMRLRAKPVGTFSLAGAQTKFSAVEWPFLVCDGCDLAVAANYEARGGKK